MQGVPTSAGRRHSSAQPHHSATPLHDRPGLPAGKGEVGCCCSGKPMVCVTAWYYCTGYASGHVDPMVLLHGESCHPMLLLHKAFIGPFTPWYCCRGPSYPMVLLHRAFTPGYCCIGPSYPMVLLDRAFHPMVLLPGASLSSGLLHNALSSHGIVA